MEQDVICLYAMAGEWGESEHYFENINKYYQKYIHYIPQTKL